MSPRLSSLLFLLGEEQYRQPRAVYKYWAPCRLHFPLRPLVFGGHLFAVLVRQWIHDVSLQRLLWVLGSTVALGDDFVAMFVFGAMLGSTLDTCSSGP